MDPCHGLHRGHAAALLMCTGQYITKTFNQQQTKLTMTSSTSLRFKKFAEEGELTIDNFDVTTETLPELKDGEVKNFFGRTGV
jgi:hypothetical protein